jgi:hypothetical protein
MSLWNRLVSHVPSGEIVLNSYTRFAIWIAQHARGTRLVREILLSRESEVAQFPPVWRRCHRLAAHSTTLSRTGTIVLHYRF